MKSFEKDLQKYAEKIRLKASERRELRERILSYMEYHPLPKQGHSRAELESVIQSEPFVTFNFSWQYARIAGGIFAVFIILAPFIAERAMPGDVLYLVKTNFNETIQKQLADSPYEKIEFETKLMERRIAEARTLASEGKLTDEVKTQIAKDVKKSTKAVQSGIEELKAADAEGAAIAQIAFSTKLEVQSAVLEAAGGTEDTELIDAVRTVVKEAQSEVASSQVENKPSFEGVMAQVELETTRAYELFATVKESATIEEVADIERRLSDINRLIGEAKEAYDNPSAPKTDAVAENIDVLAVEAAPEDDVKQKAADAPRESLTKTLGLIQKLIVFMADIDVRKAVTLETLVPVVLSEDERLAAGGKEVEAISGVSAEITGRLENIDDAGVKARLVEGLARVEELTNTAVLAIKDRNVADAEALLTEARTFVNDLDTLSKHQGIQKEPKEKEEKLVVPEADTASTTEAVGTTTPETSPLPETEPEF